MGLFVVGVSHRTAPLPIREKLYVSESRASELLQALLLKGYLEEGVILSTCNRFEVYGAMTALEESLVGLEHYFCERKGLRPTELEGRWYAYSQEKAVRHLFHVASGLDSMILGETEIQGQVKNAYEKAKASGFTGILTNRIFEKALNAAKAVREQTGMSQGKSSIGSYAVEVSKKIFGETLPSKKLLVLGAGKIGKLVSRHFFSSRLTDITVVSRSYDHADQLAASLGGKAIPWSGLHAVLPQCDIVVSSTKCPRILLHAETVKEALVHRHGDPVFFIDLSVPRNIDPHVNQLLHAYLYHLDDLERMVASGLGARHVELKQSEKILEQKVHHFTKWLNEMPGEMDDKNSLIFRSLLAS